MLSKSCIYGLRASIYIALHDDEDGYVSIRSIADELDISFHFLTKILQHLTEGGIMKSYRGPSGGIRLARPASAVTLLDIVEILEGEEYFRACILGLPGCGKENPCPLHEDWARTRKRVRAMFEKARLDKLAKAVAGGRIRLADVPAKVAR